LSNSDDEAEDKKGRGQGGGMERRVTNLGFFHRRGLGIMGRENAEKECTGISASLRPLIGGGREQTKTKEVSEGKK